jgi:hypothetical protein
MDLFAKKLNILIVEDDDEEYNLYWIVFKMRVSLPSIFYMLKILLKQRNICLVKSGLIWFLWI